jgi:O-antigen ligase
MATRLAVSPALVVGTALAGATLAGAGMAFDVKPGVAVTAALCYVPLVLLNLQLGIILWLPFVSLIAADVLNVFPLAGLMILIAWLGAVASRRGSVPALVVVHARVLVAVGALVLWVLVSMAWAEQPPFGEEIFFRWLVAGAIVLVISTTLTDRRYLRIGAAAFVLGAVASAALGLLGGAVDAERGRVVGGSGDANFLAAGLVPAIVLAAGLGAGSRRLGVRLPVLAAVAFLTVGVVTTQSRGGIVAALVAAAALLVVAKRHRAWAVAFLLCVVGIAGAWFSVDTAAWERVSDFGDSTGRTEVWGVASEVWQDHPLHGVGLQGFADSAPGYARELGPLEFAEFIAEERKVVHNTYLELLAETGIVGLALFVCVVAACLRRAWRAAALFERAGDPAMAALARSVVAAILATLAAITFISAETDARLWVLLALGPALLACASGGGRGRESDGTAGAVADRLRSRLSSVGAPAPAASLGPGAVRRAAGRPSSG